MSRIVTLLAALIALAAGFAVYNFWPEEKPEALVYEPPRALKPFTLESTAAGTVENDALKGQWTLLFTGYTFCPDICPTTMSDLKGVIPDKELFPFVRDLGLMYSIPDEGEENYLVNHSAAIILVNPDGNRKAIFNADHQRGEIPVVSMDKLKKDFAIIAN